MEGTRRRFLPKGYSLTVLGHATTYTLGKSRGERRGGKNGNCRGDSDRISPREVRSEAIGWDILDVGWL